MDIQISEGSELGAEEGWIPQEFIKAICQPILDYHRAQETKDRALLSSCICDVVYRVYCTQSGCFSDWEPWMPLTRKQILGNLGKAFDHPDYHYQNRVECTHMKVNGREALVRAIETGRSWKDRTWANVEVLWHVSPVHDETWRIAGHIHHLNCE